MATHFSILAWEIPWTEEPGGLQSWGHKELDTTEQLTLSLSVHRSEYEIFALVFLTEILVTVLTSVSCDKTLGAFRALVLFVLVHGPA